MGSTRKVIAMAIFAAGLAAPALSCPMAGSSDGAARAESAGCHGRAAAKAAPCHGAAAPKKAPDCADMLCCRPDNQDRASLDRLDLRPSWQVVAAVSVAIPGEAVRSYFVVSGSDPPVSARSAFLPAGPSRAPPSFLA